MASQNPILGRFDLSEFSVDPTPGEDGLVAEISASVFFPSGKRFFSISSGGSNRISVINWSDPENPTFSNQRLIRGYQTTSVTANKDLVAIAATPDDYDATGDTPDKSQINFFLIQPSGSLLDLGSVFTGFLTDGITFSKNKRKIFAANEGQPNADYSVDPEGSVSIVELNRQRPGTSAVANIELPELSAATISLLGAGIRQSGRPGITRSFSQDAEPEYLAEAGNYLFVTLQENNTVARINLLTNQVEAYIGLGWVDYRNVSVDLNDRDDGFNPITDQNVVGLRMPDGIAAWKQGRNIYFITANEGDGREYGDYLDEIRNGDLETPYNSVPGRLKLISEIYNDSDSSGQNALILNSSVQDTTPTNDFVFQGESEPRTGTPVSYGSRSLSLFDGVTGQLLWDSWMTDIIDGKSYNTSLQNIAEFAGIYDDGRSDDKGVEPETVAVLRYKNRQYAVGALERTTGGLDPVTQGGLLVVYDVTDVNNVDFITYQQVSRSPEGLEVIQAKQSPTGRVLLGVSAEFDSNSVEYLDFGTLLNNGNGAAFLASDLANPSLYSTL